MIDRDTLAGVIQDATMRERDFCLELADLIFELDVQAPIGDPETTEIVNGWLVDTSNGEPEPLIDLKTLNGWPGRRIEEIILGTDWTNEQARDLGRAVLRVLGR